MNIPNFIIESLIYDKSNSYRNLNSHNLSSNIGSKNGNSNLIIPALPRRDPDGGNTTSAMLRADCISDCLDSGASATGCIQRCNPLPRPYKCVPQDNSINNFLCNTGCDAWGAGASAICDLIPIGFLKGLCKQGVNFVVTDCKSGCAGPTICV